MGRLCALFLFLVGGILPPSPLVGPALAGERTFKVTFYCSCKKCCGRYSPQRGGSGNTTLGHAPLAFRSVAVGDRSLLGKWIYFQDLGGWVYASDTGAKCKRKGQHCVANNQVDVFVGGPEMHRHALRLGVMEWTGRVLEKEDGDAEVRTRGEAVQAEVLPR